MQSQLKIADFIDEVIINHTNEEKLKEISLKVEDFLKSFPLYKELI